MKVPQWVKQDLCNVCSLDITIYKLVHEDLEFLKTLIEQGRLRSVIGRSYPLTDIVEAHRHADTNHKVGNIVVAIPETASPPTV